MGILNVTPDSFADGGRFLRGGRVDVGAAVDAAHAMVAAGAAIIDVGGESTRPGAEAVDVEVELNRVIPVVERIASIGTIVSVDTSKAAVADAALVAGAHMINDVRAGADVNLLDVVARHGAALCLMHMRGEPRTMQDAPEYQDVVSEVCSFLAARAALCCDHGVAADSIVVDPGFGFGKTTTHNLTLLRRLGEIVGLGYPVLVGLSRKRTIGALTGRDAPAERVFGSVAAAVLAIERGADIVRVHDVAATMDAVRVAAAVKENSST
jgi:dihydropteroate synthase